MIEQLDFTDATLEKEWGIGCLRIKGAHLWPIAYLNWHASESRVGAMFGCEKINQWEKGSSLIITVFRLPDEQAKLAKDREWFARKRGTRRKRIADGQLFEEDMLHVKSLGEGWDCDCYARSKREIIRFYEREDVAVMFRFRARSGTLLDHPVFKRVVRNLAVISRQWETAVPGIIDCTPASRRVREEALTAKEQELVVEVERETTKQLKPSKPEPTSILEAVEAAIELERDQKSTFDERFERAIDLGTVIGQVFCRELAWEWCRIGLPGDEKDICVCSPDRSLAVDPVIWVFDLMEDKQRAKNCLLTFNILRAGEVPSSRPKRYHRIG